LSHIKFAKLVWNLATTNVRKKMLPITNTWFMMMVKNSKMTSIINFALREHLKHVVAPKDSSGWEAYLDIKRKYDEAKIKQGLTTAWTDQMTPGEERTIQKFEQLQRERGPDVNKPRETHRPNQNAVTYVFQMAQVIMTSKYDIWKKGLKASKAFFMDMLQYFQVHGQKTLRTFQSSLLAWPDVEGQTSNEKLIEPIQNVLTDELFSTSTEDNTNNRNVSNHCVTLKRIIRLVHIFTKFPTAWGYMKKTSTFVEDIIELHETETAIKSKDQIALSIIWYHCIKRSNLAVTMVDHHELSAYNVLCSILGKNDDQKNGFDKPDDAFALDQQLSIDFP